MTEDTDFALLYRELGITHACTPEAFRLAYRRRVSRLHPDQGGSVGDVERLQDLNRLYDAALDFLREHGRLPGAASPSRSQTEGQDAPAPAAPPSASPGASHANPVAVTEDEAGQRRLSRYFILLALLAIATLIASALQDTVRREAPYTGPAGQSAAVPADTDATIALGMGKERVKAIQGAPLGSHDIRWDYGPSWIDFRCGDVVTDWYSSPLRPLRTATPHPTARDWDRFDAASPPGC